jgi:PKD repeat protein
MRSLRGLVVLGILGLAACGDDDGTGASDTPRTNSPPSAAFMASCADLTCTLTDQSADADGTIQAHAWEFGDGGTSSEPNPTHTYADPGTFTVRLTVTDDGGDTGTVARDVTVSPVHTVPGYSGTYERETPHTSSERHSRYVLQADGQFELHDTKGSDSVVYTGRWTVYDPDTPWIDLDFDAFAGGDCVPPGLPFHWEGIGVFFEISGAIHLAISYCGDWYLQDRQDGEFPEEGFYARAAAPEVPGPPPAQAGQLAFVREGRIHLVSTDGTGVVPVSEGPGDAEPAWSPDGRRIAFTRSGGAATGIYVMDADGSNPVQRTTSGRSPTWSPDGVSLAFVCTEREDGLCSINVDSVADPVVIWPPTPAPRTSFPAWSPDGGRISFTSDYQGYDVFFDIFVVAPDGSGLTALTSAVHRPHVNEFYQSAWSPDGQRIALVTCPWGFEYCSSSVVSVMRADGTAVEWLAAVSGFARPTWSPDGQAIAFASANAIEWISADGSERGRILADGHSPAWRR